MQHSDATVKVGNELLLIKAMVAPFVFRHHYQN